ncbi:porin [endosymbiont of unidentified scaly snail isolate Monju]|uniref:porin n=1 Tax=endosymbiont of unidentified scaly snail isolate Monju TaxID=1248727 RepID=UPI0003891DF4|nr:porin [endosymbiont of unidentified scaly snail isolate Monju]BAN70183.1 outer membrane protein [endosymbiont of unidentified scaly snail isolate Monju]
MNKKLIAAAIAAVVAAPAAVAADTTLYGKAHVSIQSNDNSPSDNYTVNSNASRVGIKGSEDLGDGLKAIFKYEMGYNISDGGAASTPISARSAYVGLSGSWGTFLAGRHDTPAKVAFYASGTDFLGDSVIDMNKIGFTEVRADNAIAYISPNMSGFTVAAAIVPGEQSGVRTTTTVFSPIGTTTNARHRNTNFNSANNLADAYSLALIYGGGGLKVGIGYEVFTGDFNGGGAAKDQTMWQVGASYTFGDFTVGANYEDKSDIGVAGDDRTVWGLAGKANFGNNFVVINYGEKDPSGAANKVKRFGIGVGHKFSKRTQVYAAYANQNNPVATPDTSNFALGMIHTF